MPATVNLTAYRGDTWQQTFRLRDSTGEYVDLTTSTIACWAASNGSDHHELTVTLEPDTGAFTISQPPDTAGPYQYDVEIVTAGAVTTWIRGRLIVEHDITNRLP